MVRETGAAGRDARLGINRAAEPQLESVGKTVAQQGDEAGGAKSVPPPLAIVTGREAELDLEDVGLDGRNAEQDARAVGVDGVRWRGLLGAGAARRQASINTKASAQSNVLRETTISVGRCKHRPAGRKKSTRRQRRRSLQVAAVRVEHFDGSPSGSLLSRESSIAPERRKSSEGETEDSELYETSPAGSLRPVEPRSVNQKVAPRPSSLSQWISPPCAWTMFRETARPRPTVP